MTLKLNIPGFHKLRTLPVMDDLVMDAAKKAAEAAGPDFVAELSPGKNRARATVHPNTEAAAVKTARDPHLLLAALNAARD